MIAIITGDIINSRKATNNDWLISLKSILNKIDATSKNWEIYRGDSFQIEIKNPAKALFYALQLKAEIKKIKNIDIRLAIGIGSKNFSANKITEANGEAFINSGFAFDNLLKNQNLALKTPWKNIDNEFDVSLSLALRIMDNWTINSAEIVSAFLNNPNETQKNIAKKLSISESSTSERKKRAGFNEIIKLENRFSIVIHQKLSE